MAINTSSSSQFLVNFLQKDVNNHQENKSKPKTNRSLSDSSNHVKSQLDLAAEEILASTSQINNLNQGKVLSCGKKRTASLDANLQHVTNNVTGQQQQPVTTTHALLGHLQELLTTNTNKSKPDLAEINKALSALQKLQASTTSIPTGIQQHQKRVSLLQTSPSSLITVPHLPSQMSSRISQIHPIPKSQPTTTTDIIGLTGPQQQMLLLQLVNQNKTLLSNPSLLSAVQSPSHTVTTGKILISPTPSPLQTIAMQKTQQLVQQQQQLQRTASGSGRPVHIAPSIKTNTVQYVVSPNGTLTIQHQQPLVRYVSQSTPPSPSPVSLLSLATTNNKNKQSVTATATCNYVRIAPATNRPHTTIAGKGTSIAAPTSSSSFSSPLELENEKQRRNLYASMQQHIIDKNMDSQRVYETIPAARQFLTNMVNEENARKMSNSNHSNSLLSTSSPPAVHTIAGGAVVGDKTGIQMMANTSITIASEKTQGTHIIIEQCVCFCLKKAHD